MRRSVSEEIRRILIGFLLLPWKDLVCCIVNVLINSNSGYEKTQGKAEEIS
jgi:hypothetical protein